MDEPTNSNQINPPATGKPNQVNQSAGLTVPVGGVEGAPVNIEAPIKPPEATIEAIPSEVEPPISEEEQKAGVVVHPTEPKIHTEAVAAGVQPSIPDVGVPGFGNFPSDQVAATQDFKSGDSGQSNTWRGLLKIKEIAKSLFGSKPQEVN